MKKVIGVDLGGTKISAGLVGENGEILEEIKVEAQADKGRDVVLSNIKKAIYSLNYRQAEAVGIGTPGFINAEEGIVTFAGNIEGRTGLNLKEAVESFIDLPVFVENDANVALLAEMWVGSGKNYNDLVLITLGTGLGGAVYTKGKGFLTGSNYQGAELGHLILYPNGRGCTCGQRGCAEAYCAGTAIGSHYYELTGEKLSGEEVFARISSDENARKVADDYATDLSYLLTSLRNIFDPQAIIIGGGVINAKDVRWDRMIESFNSYCHNAEKLDILPASLLNDAGTIGAGRLALERIGNGKQ